MCFYAQQESTHRCSSMGRSNARLATRGLDCVIALLRLVVSFKLWHGPVSYWCSWCYKDQERISSVTPKVRVCTYSPGAMPIKRVSTNCFVSRAAQSVSTWKHNLPPVTALRGRRSPPIPRSPRAKRPGAHFQCGACMELRFNCGVRLGA